MDATTLLLFFFVAFLVLCWRKERSDFVRQIELIPGPPFKLPIIGNLLNFPRNGRGKKVHKEFLSFTLALGDGVLHSNMPSVHKTSLGYKMSWLEYLKILKGYFIQTLRSIS